MNDGARRRLALLPLGVLATSGFLVSLGTPALAVSGSITSPSNGAVFQSYAPVDISASLQRNVVNDSGKVTLSLTVPGGSTYEVGSASGNTKSISYSFTPTCPGYGGGCGGAPANNGTYTVKLAGGSANDTRTFTMKVAPAKPTGLTAEKTGQRQITLHWTRGAEADLLSYDVFTAEGVFLQTVPANTTAFVIDYGQDRYGGEHSFQVRSARRTCPTCDTNPLLSTMSTPASATLTEPSPEPPPSPTPSQSPSASSNPTSSPSTGGGFGGSPTPTTGTGGGTNPTTGSGGASNPPGGFGGPSASTSPTKAPNFAANTKRTQISQFFKQFAPSLGVPKLPPLPEFAPPPEEDGEYGTTLGYGDRYQDVAVGGFGEGGVRQVVDDVISTVFEGGRLWTSIAAALLLMLSAGHLRVWLNMGNRN